MKSIVGARVRERREAAGLSQTDLAAKITELGFGPLSYQSIQQLEDGTVKKPRYAVHLAAALKTSWEYLTNQTDNPAVPSDISVKESFKFPSSNGQARPHTGVGQEGPLMLAEFSLILGQMEGRMEARAEARFNAVSEKLDNHERRIAALEEHPLSGPQKGRRR